MHNLHRIRFLVIVGFANIRIFSEPFQHLYTNMNKRNRLLSFLLATIGCSGIASLTLSAPSVLAGQKPECYMIDESGQLIDLSSLCNSSSHPEQATTERSSFSSNRLTPKSGSSVVEQLIGGINQTTSVPLLYSNSLPIGFSVGSTSSLPLLFAGSVPVAYESFSNLAYTSPTFWVRSFQETEATRSASFVELATLVNLLQQGKPLIFIYRYE